MQQMQQLVDYIGVDYPGAISQGKVQNEVEYAEMLDFANTVAALAENLPVSPVKEAVTEEVVHLKELVSSKASAKQVSDVTGNIRQLLINGYDLAVVPGKLPDLQHGKALFAAQCTACHGEMGKGDGSIAATLKPVPTDFTDLERYHQRTLYGLYSTLTHGVEVTRHSQKMTVGRWLSTWGSWRLCPICSRQVNSCSLRTT